MRTKATREYTVETTNMIFRTHISLTLGLIIGFIFTSPPASALTISGTMPSLDSYVLTSASVSAGTNGLWRSQYNYGSAANTQSVIEGFTSLGVTELLSVRNDVLTTLGESVSSTDTLWFNVYSQDADGYHAYVGLDELGVTFSIQDYAGNWVDSNSWSVGGSSAHSILAPIIPIPEPSTALVMAMVLGGLGAAGMRRPARSSGGSRGKLRTATGRIHRGQSPETMD